MKCPNDSTTLVMADRQGIEIDYCPDCRGVWLDRGELDKLIDRSNQPAPHSVQPRPYPVEERHYNDGYHHQKRHKKEGFLGDFFDF